MCLLAMACARREPATDLVGTAADTADPTVTTTTSSSFPGTAVLPALEDTFAMMHLRWTGEIDGHEVQSLWLSFDAMVDAEGASTRVPIDEGEPLDDCTSYDVVGQTRWGDAVDGGAFEVSLGSRSWQLHWDPNGGYTYGSGPSGGYLPQLTSDEAAIEPEWGAPVSASLEGSDLVPGFDLDPLTLFPAGPIRIEHPVADSGVVLAPDTATLRWNGLHDIPLSLLIHPSGGPPLNIECTVTDDGEFTLPSRVFGWLGADIVRLEVTMYRDRRRAVEVEPDRWAVFFVDTLSSVVFDVDPTP
jgi:hypothetical protein